jgi:hypothetical protein
MTHKRESAKQQLQAHVPTTNANSSRGVPLDALDIHRENVPRGTPVASRTGRDKMRRTRPQETKSPGDSYVDELPDMGWHATRFLIMDRCWFEASRGSFIPVTTPIARGFLTLRPCLASRLVGGHVSAAWVS